MPTSTRKPSGKLDRCKASHPDTEARYHYPRSMLDQPFFVSPVTEQAEVHLSMLADTTHYVSPLMALLDQLRNEGNDIAGAYEEAAAMRAVIGQASKALAQIQDIALRANHLAE